MIDKFKKVEYKFLLTAVGSTIGAIMNNEDPNDPKFKTSLIGGFAGTVIGMLTGTTIDVILNKMKKEV